MIVMYKFLIKYLWSTMMRYSIGKQKKKNALSNDISHKKVKKQRYKEEYSHKGKKNPIEQSRTNTNSCRHFSHK